MIDMDKFIQEMKFRNAIAKLRDDAFEVYEQSEDEAEASVAMKDYQAYGVALHLFNTYFPYDPESTEARMYDMQIGLGLQG